MLELDGCTSGAFSVSFSKASRGISFVKDRGTFRIRHVVILLLEISFDRQRYNLKESNKTVIVMTRDFRARRPKAIERLIQDIDMV